MTNNIVSSGLWKILHVSIFKLTKDGTIGFTMSDKVPKCVVPIDETVSTPYLPHDMQTQCVPFCAPCPHVVWVRCSESLGVVWSIWIWGVWGVWQDLIPYVGQLVFTPFLFSDRSFTFMYMASLMVLMRLCDSPSGMEKNVHPGMVTCGVGMVIKWGKCPYLFL